MIKAPCKDCENRHEGCHSDCERYLSFRAKKDAELENRRKLHVLEGVEINGHMNTKRLKPSKAWRRRKK